jgi:hypothetical protein
MSLLAAAILFQQIGRIIIIRRSRNGDLVHYVNFSIFSKGKALSGLLYTFGFMGFLELQNIPEVTFGTNTLGPNVWAAILQLVWCHPYICITTIPIDS